MCRVVARDSAWAQAEGGIVNIIAMTDVSACHWGSAGNAVYRRKPVLRRESACKKISTQIAENGRKGRDSQSRRM